MLLTLIAWWAYAIFVIEKSMIWFGSQEKRRIAALSGFFSSTTWQSLVFFGRVVWEGLRPAGAFSRSTNRYNMPTRLHRADIQTETKEQ